MGKQLQTTEVYRNKFSIVSLGCPKNLVDSDSLLRKLASNGFSYLNTPDDADIILINTCGFIEDAKRESIEEILRLARLKRELESQMARAPRKLIVFGCLAKRYKDELLKELPEIDAIYGVGEDEKIIEYCKKIANLKNEGKGTHRQKNLHLHQFTRSPIYTFGSYAYLKIAEGCNKRCTYCVIPSIRGRYRSVAHDKIIKDAERLIKACIKELILVAQDTACYGRDNNSTNIADLLRDVCSISGNFWIRLLYVYPSSISESLLSVIAEEDKICKYLDIPLQHSEDRILKLMNRSGSRKSYLSLIRKIRNAIPDIALRTTFIAGFPSETEKEFNSLIDFIEEVRFDRLGVFKYSNEEGTPASKFKGQIPSSVKSRRADEIMRHQASISLEKNKELIGKKFRAIIDEASGDVATARLYSHAPEIDGVVIIKGTGVRKRESAETENLKTSSPVDFRVPELKAGDFVNIQITDAFDYDLQGIIVK